MKPTTTTTLTLDKESINPEDLSMGTLQRELNLQKKPPIVLAKLMNLLEAKRQRKGLGWSRAWNKYGLNVFRAHIHDFNEDRDYFDGVKNILEHLGQEIPPDYRDFVKDLQADPLRMAFTFYHNNWSENEQYEGLTISMGRKLPDDRTKRDRIDMILEDRRVDGKVDGKVDRIRIYICPWDRYKNDKAHFLYESKDLGEREFDIAQALYGTCLEKYQAWKDIEERQWSHWSVKYIDYFGPRVFIPQGTSFS